MAEHEQRTKANFEGIVTLATPQDSAELVKIVDHIIHKGVDVFYQIEKNRAPADELMRNIHRMNQLCGTFPALCSDEEGKSKAQKIVQNMEQSARGVQQILDAYRPGTRFEVASGKKLADEMRSLLSRMVEITEAMDEEQLKRIMRSIKKCFEAVLLLKETTTDYRFEQKTKIYHMNIDVLIKLIETRVEVIDRADHKQILSGALDALKTHKEPLVSATLAVASSPTQDNLTRQADELRHMLGAVSDITNVIKLPPPKSKGSLDHEFIINENLDHLRDAVSAGSASAAADAARRIMDELNRLAKDGNPDEDDDEEARRRAREALENAAKNLKNLTGGLVLAAKNAIQDPTPKNKDDLDKKIDDMRNQVKAAKRDYDTVTTSMKSSGMIEAAAAAALQLQNLFKDQ